MDHEQAARRWIAALSAPTEQAMSELGEVVAEDVATASPTGTANGRADVLATFAQSPLASFFAQATWTEPTVGETVEVSGTFPPQAPVGGVTLRFTFGPDDRISRVETSLLPGPPPVPTKIEITEEMKAAVDGALVNRTPITVAYVDADGQPHLSLRGTTQVFGDDQLAIWIRDPKGGLVSAIEENPHLALLYRDSATRTTYQFYGRAHVDRSDQTAEIVYSNSPELERNVDLQRKGVAVIVALDRVEGRDGSGAFVMKRDLSG
jgi:hypothetical protein